MHKWNSSKLEYDISCVQPPATLFLARSVWWLVTGTWRGMHALWSRRKRRRRPKVSSNPPAMCPTTAYVFSCHTRYWTLTLSQSQRIILCGPHSNLEIFAPVRGSFEQIPPSLMPIKVSPDGSNPTTIRWIMIKTNPTDFCNPFISPLLRHHEGDVCTTCERIF